ncbi:MAG: PQQ-binding-like beta-propeller repeat protein [Planctomycetaceae bacterium]|nr:PQQ-binding-like beta-propeller repeat protein [Planctomycetaceae bacterium]
MSRRSLILTSVASLVAAVMLTATAMLGAAVIGGTVQKVGKTSLTIQQKSGGTKSFPVTVDTEVTIDGRKTTIDQLKEGQLVTVTTSKSGNATKVAARGEGVAARPVIKQASEDPIKPEPVVSKPSTSPRAGTSKRGAGVDEAGWTQYRGPGRANRSGEVGLLTEWSGDGPSMTWVTGGMGEGYSSVSVADDIVYTMGTSGDREMVFAIRLNGDSMLWSTPTGGGIFRENNGNGPRGTPTIDGDNVYALGALGDLVCLNRADGKKKWGKNILKEFQADNIVWGICESVLIDGPNLICTPGGRRGTMVALNKQNGNVVWTAQVPNNPHAGYASAIIVTTGGIRQYVNFTQRGIVGINAANGTVLWGDDHSANGTANCSSPVAWDDYVFAASGYGKGGAAVRLSKSGKGVDAEFLYHTDDMKNHHGGMVVVDGYVYGFDEAVLTCLDIKTGKVAWKNRSVGKGSVTFADGHLYCRSEGGEIALVEATPKSYVEKGRFRPEGRSSRPAWAHPVVIAGKLLIRDQDKLIGFDVKAN